MTALADDPTAVRLLIDLEPVVEQELNRHISQAREWFPHEYVPWSQGEDFSGPLGGREWAPDERRFTEAARTSLVINLLTEDNLPSYHYEIATIFGRDGAWGEWVGRWTAEEGRHGMAIRDYLLVTRSVDPVELERARMTHMQAGFAAIHPGLLAGLSYVSFQELATRVSHRNTGAATEDPIGEQLLARIALDENLHMVFYRNVLGAAFEIAPDETMQAVTNSVRDFAMPGHGIDGFERKAVQIAVAGIYDLRQHRDEVVLPVLRAWKVFEREDLGPDGERAREELAQFLDGLDASAKRFEEKRDALKARLQARGD
ncbi:MAG: acyl-ACP desaturase [Actinomycetales bacterium]|nr:acyl-ACP desaturase [Actinomycetales bacterium]